ncbi:hypothetical protein BJY52DRAFT_1217584 [Lactarius psammicola]|nr:hypothetical protein BJY52DRAFT_1217584 [Lactarius psammicola]
MMRTYAFSGRKKRILAVLSTTFFCLAGVLIWVTWKQIIRLSRRLFDKVKRTSCFSITDPPTVAVVKTAGEAPGFSRVQAPFAYHLGLIFILTASFDGLNLFVVVWHCIRERGTLGPLSQSFLKQGILAYVIMTVLNMLTIGTFFSTRLLHEAKGIGPWFAYIIPSPLSCRLLLMLRRKASPTDTDLRIQYSHMVNEALEMVAVEWHPEEVSEGFTPSISTEAQAQP